MLATLSDNFISEKMVLTVALELSNGSWKMGLSDGRRAKPAVITVSDEHPHTRQMAAMKVIQEILVKWLLPSDTKESASVITTNPIGKSRLKSNFICHKLN